MARKQLYSLEAILNLRDKYLDRDGMVYTIYGTLLDNYIFTAPNCKTTIVKEQYLNAWSSAYTITMYNKMPKKYEKVIDALIDGDEEKADKLFFGGK